MTRLRTVCRQHDVNDRANAKVVLIARLMERFRDCTAIHSFETHDISTMCGALHLSSYGTREEKIKRIS